MTPNPTMAVSFLVFLLWHQVLTESSAVVKLQEERQELQYESLVFTIGVTMRTTTHLLPLTNWSRCCCAKSFDLSDSILNEGSCGDTASSCNCGLWENMHERANRGDRTQDAPVLQFALKKAKSSFPPVLLDTSQTPAPFASNQKLI